MESSVEVLHHSSMVSSGHGDLPTSPMEGDAPKLLLDTTQSDTTDSATHPPDELSPVHELSPCGSLTNKTLNSMIETVYEKSIFDRVHRETESTEDSRERASTLHSGGSFQSAISGTPQTLYGSAIDDRPHHNGDVSQPLPAEGDVIQAGSIRYWYNDFSIIDHRLKLHFTMTLFEEEDEEFALILRVSNTHTVFAVISTPATRWRHHTQGE